MWKVSCIFSFPLVQKNQYFIIIFVDDFLLTYSL